jgi:hypothetical protein
MGRKKSSRDLWWIERGGEGNRLLFICPVVKGQNQIFKKIEIINNYKKKLRGESLLLLLLLFYCRWYCGS